jgi:hypothetical protein
VTGSGESRAGKNDRDASCARNEKWITSVAAIVASFVGTLVRGALVLKHRRVPFDHDCFGLAFLPVFRSMPLPQYPAALCSLILVISFSVQNFKSRPSTIPGVGAGICLFRIQRRSVVRSTSNTVAASETE